MFFKIKNFIVNKILNNIFQTCIGVVYFPILIIILIVVKQNREDFKETFADAIIRFRQGYVHHGCEGAAYSIAVVIWVVSILIVVTK